MCRVMRKEVSAVLLIAWLHARAHASPGATPEPSHDRDGTDPAPPVAGPWLDLSPQPGLAVRSHAAPRDHRLASALTLGGVYAGFITWTYFAWYRREGHEFRFADATTDGNWKLWSDEGWFGTKRYAGGSDKLGHTWATLALARAGTEMLHQWGGYDRTTSAIVGAALSEALFLGVEIKDGFAYSFSTGDFVFNTAGAALALAQSLSPRFDELVDFRVEYFPSAAYRARARANSDVDVAEDYSGQTYVLAFHLGAIRPLRSWRYGAWSDYVDLSLGFASRGYKPDPLHSIDTAQCMLDGTLCDFDKSQDLFVGISLNAQGVFDKLLRGRSEGLRKVTHGTFEVFGIPYTTLPLATHTRAPVGGVPDEQ